jgi:hypothetical protein
VDHIPIVALPEPHRPYHMTANNKRRPHLIKGLRTSGMKTHERNEDEPIVRLHSALIKQAGERL